MKFSQCGKKLFKSVVGRNGGATSREEKRENSAKRELNIPKFYNNLIYNLIYILFFIQSHPFVVFFWIMNYGIKTHIPPLLSLYVPPNHAKLKYCVPKLM